VARSGKKAIEALLPLSSTKSCQPIGAASKTVEQPGFNPSNYTFIGGTEGIDNFSNPPKATADPDVICGFGGDDAIFTVDAGDIFLGGEGNEFIAFNSGTVYGGEGKDFIDTNKGTFDGGAGIDEVSINEGGILINVEVHF